MSASEKDREMWTKSAKRGRRGSKRHIYANVIRTFVYSEMFSHIQQQQQQQQQSQHIIWHTSNISGFECGLLCYAWIINANETRQTRHNRCCAAVLHAPCSKRSATLSWCEWDKPKTLSTDSTYVFFLSFFCFTSPCFLSQFLLVFSPVVSLWMNK